MCECEWKDVRNESDVTTFLAPSSRPRCTMTQQHILAAVVDGTLFGISEMQLASITRDDIGSFMRQYAEEHDILSKPRVMLVGSLVLSISCSPHHCYDGTVRMDSWWSECTKLSSMNLTPAFDGLVSGFPLDALEMKTSTKPSLPRR